MRLYHLTPDAERVLTLGFTDGEEQPGEDGAVHRGVWFSDRPLEARAGVLGDTLLAIELPEQVASRHELRLPAASAFREFCIPAEQLRSVPIVMLAERVLPSRCASCSAGSRPAPARSGCFRARNGRPKRLRSIGCCSPRLGGHASASCSPRIRRWLSSEGSKRSSISARWAPIRSCSR